MSNNGSSKICDKCRKIYYRSNLVRAWVATNFGHRYGWVRGIQKLCCRCMSANEAKDMMREINPHWRPPKPVEKVAGFTPKKTEAAKL